jgi:hypothetical protein
VLTPPPFFFFNSDLRPTMDKTADHQTNLASIFFFSL